MYVLERTDATKKAISLKVVSDELAGRVFVSDCRDTCKILGFACFLFVVFRLVMILSYLKGNVHAYFTCALGREQRHMTSCVLLRTPYLQEELLYY